MNIDKAVFAFAGVMILISICIVQFVAPWGWLLAAFVGLNLLQAAFSGFCPAAKLFAMLGLPAGAVFK